MVTDRVIELKPCPFCGEQELLEYEVVDHGEGKRPLGFRFTAKVTCLGCFASCGTHGFHHDGESSKRAAFRAWNRRVGDSDGR